MSSDLETSDSCLSDTEPHQSPIPRDVAAATSIGDAGWDRQLIGQLDDDRDVGPQLANLGRNLSSIHSFLHTNLLILVPNVSPVLEIPKKDVTPIGSRGTRSSGRVFAHDPPKPASEDHCDHPTGKPAGGSEDSRRINNAA